MASIESTGWEVILEFGKRKGLLPPPPDCAYGLELPQTINYVVSVTHRESRFWGVELYTMQFARWRCGGSAHPIEPCAMFP